MTKVTLFVFLLMTAFLVGCNTTETPVTADLKTETIATGEYCAQVTYYYSKTGTKATYTLNVIVENNELVDIYWSDGGWTGTELFPTQALSNGSCSFITDLGYQFDVTITGPKCAQTDELKMYEELHSENEAFTCPLCGESKHSLDNYCINCTEDSGDICYRCDMNKAVFGGLCSSCIAEE